MTKIRQTGNIKKNSFELAAWSDQAVVVGIDEVGRGCLAGPLVAAAVILPINKAHRMLKDSKIMSADEREKAFLWIKRHCSYGIGVVNHRIIDKQNIYRATLLAMKKALLHLLQSYPGRPCAIVVDAMPLDLADTHFHDIPVYHFPKGETKSSSIAAASIVAKVTRDAMMESYDLVIPGYALTSNKGYGTAVHKVALQSHDSSIIHRKSFLTKLCSSESETAVQLEIGNGTTSKIFCGSD